MLIESKTRRNQEQLQEYSSTTQASGVIRHVKKGHVATTIPFLKLIISLIQIAGERLR
jgi:hypothetical protein